MNSRIKKTPWKLWFVAGTLLASLWGNPGEAFAQDPSAPPPPPPPYPYPYVQPGQTAYPPYGYPPGAYAGMPEILPFKEDQPIPPGYKVERRVRKGLLISGAVIFGTVYFFTAVGGGLNLNNDRAPYGALFVPVFGPFIVAGTGRFSSGDLGKLMFAFDGVLQAGGAAMLLSGIFAKKKVLVRQDAQIVTPELLVGPGAVGLKLTF